MISSKIKYLFLAFLLVSFFNIYSASFTYSEKPTYGVIPYGSTSRLCTYRVSYSGTDAIRYIKLIVMYDGAAITETLNTNPENKNLPTVINIDMLEGVHTVSFALAGMDPERPDPNKPIIYQEADVFEVVIPFSVRVRNNFPGGTIIVRDVIKNSPVDDPCLVGHTRNIGAIEQTFDNYNRVWNNSGSNNSSWKKIRTDGFQANISTDQNTTYNVETNDKSTCLEAGLKKVCNVNVQRSSLSGNGIIYVTQNGVQSTITSTDQTFNVVEGNTISLSVEDVTIDNIDYIFDGWTWTENGIPGSDKTRSRSFNPDYHTNITGSFKGYANISMMNVQSNDGEIGESPNIHWTDNPNSNVSYKIQCTMFKKNSPDYMNCLPQYLSQGVQSFTVTSFGGNHEKDETDRLNIALYALYSVENTERFVNSKDFYVPLPFSDDENPPESKRNAGIHNGDIITKYSVANYPNPFNPTTVINYQVPEAGHVTLKVYDVMGREIASLVDGVKAKGSYNVNFSMEQHHLASGIYFCRLSAGKNVVTTKMILSK